jgi:hypothetical protein
MRSNQTGHIILASLVFPFWTYLYGMWKKEMDVLKFALPIFYGLIGYTFQLRGNSDAFRAVEQFEDIANTGDFSFFNYFISKVINFRSEGTEVYYDLLSYVTSFFSDDWRFFFMLNGFISGVIVYNIVKVIYEKLPNTNFLVLFLISFICLPISLLNGRFWLSSTFFVLMVLKYTESNNLKYVFLSFLCVFIHQGLALACIIFVLFHFLKYSKMIIVSIYFLSLLYAGSGSNFVGNALNIFSGKVADQIEGYARIDVEESRQRTLDSRSQNFMVYSMRNTVLSSSVLVGIFYLLFLRKDNEDDFLVKIVLLSLLFFAFSNFTSSVASLGGRYLRIGIMIGVIPLLLNLASIKYKLLRYPIILTLLFIYIIDFRLDAEQLNGFFFLFGYPQALITVPDLTLLEIIK